MNMRTYLRRQSTIFAITVAAILWICGPILTFGSPTNNVSKILFLHAQIKQGRVTLVTASVSPGVLKPSGREEIPDGLHFALVATNEQVLWTGVMEDPRVRRFEFEEQPHTGKMKRKIIQNNEAEFSLRVPLQAGAQRIDFYTLELPAPATGKAAVSNRKSLGSVTLPPNLP